MCRKEMLFIYEFAPAEIQRLILAMLDANARLKILAQRGLRLVLGELKNLSMARMYIRMVKICLKRPHSILF